METPDLTQRFIPYLIWFIIVILTNYFFSISPQKTKSIEFLLWELVKQTSSFQYHSIYFRLIGM